MQRRKNKPVICCNSGFPAHLQLLKDKAIQYNEQTLEKILTNLNKEEIQTKDWNAYKQFTPEKVMSIFKRVFINNCYNIVSGYEFYRICKWSFCPRYLARLEPNNIKHNDTLFLNLDYFGHLLNSLRNYPPANKFVLISHNSDQKFTEAHFNAIRHYVSHIYAINCVFQHPMITPIPIGFIDSKYSDHSKILNIEDTKLSKEHLLYMNFVITTNPPKRNECLSVFQNQDWVLKEKIYHQNCFILKSQSQNMYYHQKGQELIVIVYMNHCY